MPRQKTSLQQNLQHINTQIAELTYKIKLSPNADLYLRRAELYIQIIMAKADDLKIHGGDLRVLIKNYYPDDANNEWDKAMKDFNSSRQLATHPENKSETYYHQGQSCEAMHDILPYGALGKPQLIALAIYCYLSALQNNPKHIANFK